MMPECKQMIHPFQTDAGTSQRQRLLEDLLSGTAKIDGRSLADLLDFFVQLSRHVNFYNEKLEVSDWQSFFHKSLPFTVASIIKYDRTAIENKLAAYKKRFDQKPSAAGLQLLFSYTYSSIIKKINSWQLQVAGTGIPLEPVMEKLIKDKLSGPVKDFIRYANAGTHWFCTKNFSFSLLGANPVWGLTGKDQVAMDEDFKTGGNTKRKRLVALYNKTSQLVQSFFDAIRILNLSAEQSLEQSLLPLKEELQQKQPPHLALLFAFLKLFQYLQGDLNSFTRKHLDFFYKQVLLLKPKEAVPDKLHMVFEIQKQLDQYLLKKGLLVKDGKDSNKQEIFFATEDEIVVNKTQVADQRTLFLNNQVIKRQPGATCLDRTVVEGVYMAPDSAKANGVDKEFKDGLPSRATLGDKWSKYADPENKFIYPYPNARLGFILASPVLLLNEGTRKVIITLNCELEQDYCGTLSPVIGEANRCCDDKNLSNSGQQLQKSNNDESKGVPSEAASELYNSVSATLGRSYYYINRLLIADAVKKGVGKETLQKLGDLLTKMHTKNEENSEICYCSINENVYERTIPDTYAWNCCRYYAKNDLVTHNNAIYQAAGFITPIALFTPEHWKKVDSWQTMKGYKTGDIVFYTSNVYRSLKDHLSGEAFDPHKWDSVSVKNIQCGINYQAGSLVFYKNIPYQATTATPFFDTSKWVVPDTYLWKPCRSYSKNDLIKYNNIYYRATDYIASNLVFTAAHWKKMESWQTSKDYKNGDIVFRSNNAYRCIIEHRSEITFDVKKWQKIPVQNIQCGISYQPGSLVFHESTLYQATAQTNTTPLFDASKWTITTDLVKGFEEQFTPEEQELLKDIFYPRNAFNLLFSSEKEWLSPLDKPVISLVPHSMNTAGNFSITITATLKPEEAAVTFYNAEVLKEDFNTSLPLVKIDLDDKIKLNIESNTCTVLDGTCCEKTIDDGNVEVSLYHFFRNVKLLNATKIDVEVCGVKNLIVQNDENLENVNSPIRAFGSRPKVGANFYIGSKEVFSKNWKNIYVNAEWKDRPRDFAEHYKHYSYRTNKFENNSTKIVESSFRIKAAVLDNGEWKPNDQRRLFKLVPGEIADPVLIPPTRSEIPSSFCNHINSLPFDQDIYDYIKTDFPGLTSYKHQLPDAAQLTPYNISSLSGFVRFTLEGLNFQHDIYPFVLTRQMMAYARLVSPEIIGLVLKNAREAQQIIIVMSSVIGSIISRIAQVKSRLTLLSGRITSLSTFVGQVQTNLNQALTFIPISGTTNIPLARARINTALNLISTQIIPLLTGISNSLTADQSFISTQVNAIEQDLIKNPGAFDIVNPANFGLNILAAELKTRIDFIVDKLKVDDELHDGLPSEPYTPVIKSLSLDYTATADVFDIDLIHLYPYAGTFKPESLPQQPTLFPTFCDEGNFFIGLKDLVPGSNVNILFQLAEATADSESEREELVWHYLENNAWKLLRTGFEVLSDDTNGLTTSGIIKFSMPANMTNENTVLPKGLHWIRAAIPQKSKSVSEIIGIYTQAIKAIFTNDAANDKLRLSAQLPAGSVAKLKDADANLKKITQPFEAFGGREPEAEGHFYIRTSELMRHKNRAIQKFDYERLTLEAFPQIYKAKCINHSYALDANKYINDFPVAPGYVLIAVIPDLNKLKAAQSFEPKAPVSLLEDIGESLKKVASPFVRFWIKNPRYEKVNFCLRVKLLPGKDEVFYKEKLKQDTREFLAPWAIGEFDKLTFGQPINRSDMIRFLETRDYLDYIIDLKMIHADEGKDIKDVDDNQQEIVPITPRSILIAGSIDVCIDPLDCETWCACGKDASGNNVPCCDHKKIPVMEYCNDNESR